MRFEPAWVALHSAEQTMEVHSELGRCDPCALW